MTKKKKRGRTKVLPSREAAESRTPLGKNAFSGGTATEPNERHYKKRWLRRFSLKEKNIPWWNVVPAGIGIVLTIVGLLLTYFAPWRIQEVSADRAVSNIQYAFFIKPAPVPGEQFENNGRWEVSIMVANAGPRTAQSLVLNLHTPDPQLFLHSEPRVMSSPAAAEVQINKRIPDGIYQVVLKDFVPGDTCFLNMFYRTTDDKREEFYKRWTAGGLFDKDFGKRFINQFWFTGENLKVQNVGALELEPSFEPL